MKTIFKTSAGLAFAAAVFTLGACTQSEAKVDVIPKTAANTVGTVKVNISGFETQEGIINAGLFNETGYKGGDMVAGQKVPVDAPEITLVFENIPAGEYAVRMYRDVNSDGELNANAFGIPSEPFAFSNNAVGNMGPAKWEKARFDAQGAETVQTITLK